MITIAHQSDTMVSLLSFCIVILDVSAVKVSPTKEVFGIVATILALVRVSAPILHTSVNFH